MISEDINEHPGVIVFGALSHMLREIPADRLTAGSIVEFLQANNLILIPIDAVEGLLSDHMATTRELDTSLSIVQRLLGNLGAPPEVIAAVTRRRAVLARGFSLDVKL